MAARCGQIRRHSQTFGFGNAGLSRNASNDTALTVERLLIVARASLVFEV
jgi:hypothetical protein